MRILKGLNKKQSHSFESGSLSFHYPLKKRWKEEGSRKLKFIRHFSYAFISSDSVLTSEPERLNIVETAQYVE